MKKIILTSLFIVAALTLYGQQLQRYSGDFYLGGVSYTHGKASYTYYETPSGERIYHGSFIYKSRDVAYPASAYLGNFKNGVKDGRWTIMDGYQGLFTSAGIYNIVEGNFANGRLEGEVKVYKSSFQGFTVDNYAQTPDTTPVLRVNIHNNKIVGKIFALVDNDFSLAKFTNERYWELQGQANERGRAHGTWTIKRIKSQTQYVYIYEYFEGICYKVTLKDNSRGTIKVIHSFEDDFVTALKTTYDKNTDTFIYNGDTHKLIKVGGSVSQPLSSSLQDYTYYIKHVECLRDTYGLPDKTDYSTPIASLVFSYQNIDQIKRDKAEAVRKFKEEKEAERKAQYEMEQKLLAEQAAQERMNVQRKLSEEIEPAHRCIYIDFTNDYKQYTIIYDTYNAVYQKHENIANNPAGELIYGIRVTYADLQKLQHYLLYFTKDKAKTLAAELQAVENDLTPGEKYQTTLKKKQLEVLLSKIK